MQCYCPVLHVLLEGRVREVESQDTDPGELGRAKSGLQHYGSQHVLKDALPGIISPAMRAADTKVACLLTHHSLILEKALLRLPTGFSLNSRNHYRCMVPN